MATAALSFGGHDPVAKGSETTTVKINRAIHRKARMIAAHHDIDLSVYLSGLLEKQVDRDYAKMIAELGEEPKRS